MTSARRAARAAARVPQAVPGGRVPAELLDPDHEVWHNQAAYHRFMGQRRWTMPARERLGVPASPANRRQRAAGCWAVATGQLTRTFDDGRTQQPDWRALRAAGLC